MDHGNNPHQPYKPTTAYPPPPPTYSSAQPGYPYPAPPPPPAYYAPYPAATNNPRRATFLRRLIIGAIAAFLILGAISFILWLVLRPRLPRFSVTSATSTPLNLTSPSHLSARWHFVLSARNPNSKMSADYSPAEATLFYRSLPLASNTLNPFSQPKRNTTSLDLDLIAPSTYIGDSASRDLSSDIRASSTVYFNLRLFSYVRFRTGALQARTHPMRVMCRRIPINFSNYSASGSLFGSPKDCEVDL